VLRPQAAGIRRGAEVDRAVPGLIRAAPRGHWMPRTPALSKTSLKVYLHETLFLCRALL
jgi:hypothetical protein